MDTREFCGWGTPEIYKNPTEGN